jgi:hypothetical protein
VQFRGFISSPVSGTAKGLAFYQNGVRINEAFRDATNWDLIPTAAIRSVGVVTNNPAYGLNALGGALDIQMKNGFNYQGAEINTMAGSSGKWANRSISLPSAAHSAVCPVSTTNFVAGGHRIPFFRFDYVASLAPYQDAQSQTDRVILRPGRRRQEGAFHLIGGSSAMSHYMNSNVRIR